LIFILLVVKVHGMGMRYTQCTASGFRRLFAVAVACVVGGLVVPGALAAVPRVQSVAVQAPNERTAARLVLGLSAATEHKVFTLDGPSRLVVDLVAAEAASTMELPAPSAGAAATPSPILGVRVAKRGAGLRFVVDLAAAAAYKTRLVPAGKGHSARLEVEVGAPLPAVVAVAKPVTAPVNAAPKSVIAETPKVAAIEPAKPVVAETPKVATLDEPKLVLPDPPKAEPPPAKLVRTREPRVGRDVIIAIDAGHGGKDPGAHGLNGTQEKDVTLAVARRLAAVLEREPGMRAHLVRDGDYYVDLRQRMVRARKAGADLFVSIHADAAYNRAAAGSSVYILSTRGASSEAARWLADRENSADLAGGVQLDKVDPTVASVLMDLSQGDTITASDRAARLVLGELDRIGNVHKREVQSAGFMVLKSPDIPSMLVETAFISHPAEEIRLADPEHQQRLAEAIQNGLRAYFYNNPPPGTRVAQLAAARRNSARIAARIAATGP
jgi:N-acetylmuramoyl-L-alanine amidase